MEREMVGMERIMLQMGRGIPRMEKGIPRMEKGIHRWKRLILLAQHRLGVAPADNIEAVAGASTSL